eukprot:COSAG02_NODE_36530_length_453_cov_1.110169_2_plen_64_part_00
MHNGCSVLSDANMGDAATTAVFRTEILTWIARWSAGRTRQLMSQAAITITTDVELGWAWPAWS